MNCLFCDSRNIRKAGFPRTTNFNNKQFNYYNCEDCKLVFIDPLPLNEDYEKMYAKDYHDAFYFREQTRGTESFDLVERFKNGLDILDYGCGDGGFLKSFVKNRYTCTGVEYNKDLVAILKAKMPDARFYVASEFWETDSDTIFSIIHMGDVLEHISNPNELLGKLHKRLVPGSGILFVEGPLENNFHLALVIRKVLSGILGLFAKKTGSSHVPYHITFSNAANQEALFVRNGFQTLYYRILETAWPYPETPEGGLGNRVKYFMARLSNYFSRMISKKWGNRFVYIGFTQVKQ